jgi:signal peptidase I
MVNLLKKIGQFILETIQAIVMALSIFIIIYLFLFQPHQVKGSSMYSTFEDGEFLLTDKISYRFNSPQRGDVIVFKAPETEPCSEIECEYIKRIIGMPGDKVKVSAGHVYINNQLLEENYLPEEMITNAGSFIQEGINITVPEEYYLPMGDNRPHSRDGREFGPIPKESIVGKAFFRYWPIEKIGLFKKTAY